MKYCKLRIAWSVGWGIACLMLVVLWVRSYQILDSYKWMSSERPYLVWSNRGELNFQRLTFVFVPFVEGAGRIPALPREEFAWEPHHRMLGFNWAVYEGGWSVGVYLVVPAAFCAGADIVPWIVRGRRFSLRTLLIGMTVVGIGLGLVVWAIR